ncbi:anthranilate phosphoribosyltransferase [Helicobacter saguini]|uniref:Anthranilate phosphoribosyltransferase n=1 Tax=Helicobacter saguini TaxID=1548018 RepID=A0A347VP59_9HELI|nr:anthranilate phosphoribosyltransferase [Helicobacter saguini]MWV61501.1 anthranilate phosphoribosyltransferase [Helicobacter saguini]MWV67828.1 anthranilate phosphoribosyltransferase [Helicobacter saguini]MWV70704.1 anthranilate phosphoribosyltransferase [Helicobacter saguini]MWV72608.1 anthranilate phosphoribosyltransferase [Helicobacter saguini]TLD94583.1 anthranilate phosphoribosyltransferase [Helicobacter saguini]
MILLIDNYDSFTYNIYQLVARLGFDVVVKRNDSISIDDIRALNPSHIILGPGPNAPQDSRICLDIVRELKGEYAILGICLGHEAILHAFGVPIVNAKNIVHGKVSPLNHSEDSIFTNIPQGVAITRYHSLVAKAKDIPNEFRILAFSDDNEVMAVAHKEYALYGLQFHPESIGTEHGEKMLLNFINYKRNSIPLKTFLHKLADLQDLSFTQSYDLMECIAENDLTPAQLGSVITSFYIKKPTSDELAAFSSLLVAKAASFDIDGNDFFDIVGTGGSARKTFNVSSTAAIVLASMGVKVVKHGNRAITSKSGSADLLSALGVNINMSLSTALKCYKEIGLTFLFAPRIHSALKHVQGARRELGFKSIFNLLGPLSNPLKPDFRLIGVFDSSFSSIMASALGSLGCKRAMVVHGLVDSKDSKNLDSKKRKTSYSEGIDEFSLCGITKVSELKNGEVINYDFNPLEHGIGLVNFNDLKGGDVAKNVEITMEILSGVDSPKANLVALNVGASLYLYNIAKSIESGFHQAKEHLKTKSALKTLESFVRLSNM